jgi:hypothetical protein
MSLIVPDWMTAIQSPDLFDVLTPKKRDDASMFETIAVSPVSSVLRTAGMFVNRWLVLSFSCRRPLSEYFDQRRPC